MTTTGAPADGISQTIRFGTECTEEVTRHGLLEPCEKPGVALRVDPTEGTPYVVCARHVRAEMVPLQALADALRAEAEADLIGRLPSLWSGALATAVAEAVAAGPQNLLNGEYQ